MATFKKLAETEKNEHFKNVFSLIASHEADTDETTNDGYKEIALDSSELETIRDEMHSVVRSARPGTQTATP